MHNDLLKNDLKKDLITTPLLKDLINLGAFVGDYHKWVHSSQKPFITAYRNNHVIYDIHININLLYKAVRFLKKASKNKNVRFVFVGSPRCNEKSSSYIFKNIKVPYFPTDNWRPGYFSKSQHIFDSDKKYKHILVIYNIGSNHIAFCEAINANIPVVAFATPNCDIRGADFPVVLNLENSGLWYASFCKALVIN